MAQTGQIWLIVHAGLMGFVVIPAIVVWFLALGLARRRRDPSRVAFSWLHACHPFFVSALMLNIAFDIAGVILMSWQYDNGSFDEVSHTASAINSLDETYEYTSLMAVFFRRLVDALFVIVFAELGNGFRYAQIKKPPPFRSVVRIAAFGSAVLILALSVAYFALPLAALVHYYQSEPTRSYNAVVDAWDKCRSLEAAIDVVNFAVSIVQVVYAGLVLGQYAGLPGKKSAVLYFVSTILDALRCVVGIVLLGKWILPDEQIPYAWNAVDVVFEYWVCFIILVLLLVIGKRRQDGLWSTVQHSTQGHQGGYPQQAVHSHGQAPPTPPIYYQHPPQQQENPAWQYAQSDPAPAAMWHPHELASPQQVAKPGELDSRQMQQPAYYTSAHQVPVEVPAEKNA
ncbi:hypothetical protein J3458_001404 [Metarhizium acridum]|nr:hypothetical protein J3458_001404 [Metarhizium acridum]